MNDGSFRHSRSGYIAGCRCDICREAHREYGQEYWRRRKQEADEGGRHWGRTKRVTIPAGSFLWPGDWQKDAECAGLKTLCIPLGFKGHTDKWFGLTEARSVCQRCPVLEQCRTWVLAHDDDPCDWHIVAGLTPQERNGIRRRRGTAVLGNAGRFTGGAA